MPHRCPRTWPIWTQEREILVRALEQHGFNRTAAGASLGLTLRQMRYRIARLGVTGSTTCGCEPDETERRMTRPNTAPVSRSGWYGGARPLASPNFGARPDGAAVDLIVLHSISLPPGEYGGRGPATVHQHAGLGRPSVFRADPRHEVSAHFLIRRTANLAVRQLRRSRLACRPAPLRGRDNCNDDSVGIELEGLEGETFEPDAVTRAGAAVPPAQHYPVEHIAGHEHIAPGRKHDPGAGFDWALALESGLAGRCFPGDVAVIARAACIRRCGEGS